MSPVNAPFQKINSQSQQQLAAEAQLGERIELPQIQSVLERVQDKIAPVWPLRDYVAVNPYMGLADHEFLAARRYLKAVSDLETFMPVDYYRNQFKQGAFERIDIDAAVDELVADGVTGAERIDVNQVVAFLREQSRPSPTADAKFTKSSNPSPRLSALSEVIDRHNGTIWSRRIGEEISKHCAAHYDQGQAAWSSPWRELPLYQAWHSAMRHDRSFELLGVSGFRKFVKGLPPHPHAALVALLVRLGVPAELWEDFLLCEALTLPGWSAWSKYQHRNAEISGEEDTDFAGLLAMRLAYEVALSLKFDLHVDWGSVARHHAARVHQVDQASDEELLRYALLKASEIAYRTRLMTDLKQIHRQPIGHSSEIAGHSQPGTVTKQRGLAQMVFCIDVRSERIRRHLEATSSELETYGFAGFFGLPIELVGLGEAEGVPQVPALIAPQIRVHEEIDADDDSKTTAAGEQRSVYRFLKQAWKDFQTSAVSMFAFVETAGLLYGWKLIARSFGMGSEPQGRFDGVASADRPKLGPTLRGLSQQGICTSKQADMAESMLRGIGIVDNFSRLVVFCGHGSQTENNPLQAGLDCGACGGHTGEPNARLAAKLLNQKSVRNALAERGIEVPEQTWFVAALHNTTTDQIEFFDKHDVPPSHLGDLQQLDTLGRMATKRTRQERLAVLPGPEAADLDRRSKDWSEVRPEWGLAGNAAFIVAPRSLTESISLEGRSFLHSYDYRNDPESAVLEQIMTAPLVVANWINMQYYASMVDPLHFGSGNKTVHNVVGRFGVFSGNGGDLMTGLPWQSIHDGSQYQHHPLRLLAVIAAPRDSIHAIVGKHQTLTDLVTNGWLQLVAVENQCYYRYTEQQNWEEIAADSQPMANC